MAKQPIARKRCSADAGDGGELFQKFLLKAKICRPFITARSAIHLKQHKVFRLIPQVHFAEFRKTTNEQSGGNKQDERNRYLSDYQHFSCGKPATCVFAGRSARS